MKRGGKSFFGGTWGGRLKKFVLGGSQKYFFSIEGKGGKKIFEEAAAQKKLLGDFGSSFLLM